MTPGDGFFLRAAERFPVLHTFGDVFPDSVTDYLRRYEGKEMPDHPSALPASQLDTPMMKQFASAKAEVPDGLLFFRMGDFFELFGLDAVIASQVCSLTLTSRDKNSENPVPMAGVPWVHYKVSVRKCVDAGFKVAICDQVEDPRDAKTIVRREIVRILTPAVSGDLFDEEEASPAGAYLAAVVSAGLAAGCWTLCAVDASTGECRTVTGQDPALLLEELLALAPREILLTPEDFLLQRKHLARSFQAHARSGVVAPLVLQSEDPVRLTPRELLDRLAQIYGEDARSKQAVASVPGGPLCCVMLQTYLMQTQRSSSLHWKPMDVIDRSGHLFIDASTRSHLHLFPADGATARSSVFSLLNHCVTATGRRRLWQRLGAPFRRLESVRQSQVLTECLMELEDLMASLRVQLSACADLDRIVGRLVQGNAQPRDVLAMLRTLDAAQALAAHLETRRAALPDGVAGVLTALLARSKLFAQHPLCRLLGQAISDQAQPVLGKGEFFRAGYHAELDHVHHLASRSGDAMAELQARERELSGIPNLKIGFNKVFGFYIEISRGRAAQVPERYVRKQTLTNAERYITAELKELEDEVLHAEDRRTEIERRLFRELEAACAEHRLELSRLNDALADLDLHLSFARVSLVHGWVLPAVGEEGVTRLRGVVHPVLKAELEKHGQGFIKNDVDLGSAPDCRPVHLITGPNMAGKSTIMRQVALAQILAQMGCGVPCTHAEIGLCDKVLTRIGAHDDLLGSRSTFMVEMSETAQILRQATEKSLVLMDEIGRGTSTWDGLALAWAILEELDLRVGARVLFSTHYHELSVLAERLRQTQAMQIEVIENPSADIAEERVVFTHRYVAGAARESYGIHVARMAGLPPHILEAAESKLADLRRSALPEAATPHLAKVAVDPVVTQLSGQPRPALQSDPKLLALLVELAELDLACKTPLSVMMDVARWQGFLLENKAEWGGAPEGLPRRNHSSRKVSGARQKRTPNDLDDSDSYLF
jgi:DNA mismatch repair protein MutS